MGKKFSLNVLIIFILGFLDKILFLYIKIGDYNKELDINWIS